MKRISVILLSVTILGICGCGLAEHTEFPANTEITEKTLPTSEDMEEDSVPGPSEKAAVQDAEIMEEVPENVEDEAEKPEDEYPEGDEKPDRETSEGYNQAKETGESVENKQEAESGAREGSEETVETEPETKPQAAPAAPEPVKTPEPEPEPLPVFAAYSPQNVVSLATAKTKACGKVTLTDNLNSLLADGTITQEEYNEYYPYDGAGYYSVFVQTDLNAASTTSGRLLGSEDAIAQYIADMLSLESGPYFLIEYAGIYSTGNTDFYEFRCYRA